MKHACFVWLSLFLTATFLWCQSIPIPPMNQSTKVVPPISTAKADPRTEARILNDYGKLPLSFEANHGQSDPRVRFLSRTGGYTLFLTGDEAVLELGGKKAGTRGAKIGDAAHKSPSAVATTEKGGVLRMKLHGANRDAKVTGMGERAGRSNYFIGNDPVRWRTDVPSYAKVKYEGIYSGIDLVYYGNQKQLEYDFIVAPREDAQRISFDVIGAKRIRQNAHGDLLFEVGDSEIRWQKPVAYQEKDGTRHEIAARYAITDATRVSFELAKYDTSSPLFIDPLVYSTYLGGNNIDFGQSVALDSSGDAFVTGVTFSTNFPTMNPLQATNGGDYNAFVAKINASGSALIYSTYLGGSCCDSGNGIAVDNSGNAYITGLTQSTNFPTTFGSFQMICNGGGSGGGAGAGDAFVTEISPSGSALVYSTCLGGGSEDYGNGIAVDSSGNAYVTGETRSTDFPSTPGTFQTDCNVGASGCEDAFVAKINASGSTLVYAAYLGGSYYDYGQGIALDSAGDAFVTGVTFSNDFPVLDALQPKLGGADRMLSCRRLTQQDRRWCTRRRVSSSFGVNRTSRSRPPLPWRT